MLKTINLNSMEYKGMINIYKCSEGHETITMNRDDGATPFIICCPECKRKGIEGKNSVYKYNEARSQMYAVPPNLVPQYFWISPTDKEIDLYLSRIENPDKRKNTRAHIEAGGLVLVKIILDLTGR